MVHSTKENNLMQSSEYSTYSGHKVVASSPSSASLTSRVHELHSPRDTPPGQRRIRSHSAGRTSTSMARDIVQDVYDRMGVSRESLTQQESPQRGRGRDPTRRSEPPSADMFQQRYRAAAELSTGRGRSRERGFAPETDGQRRARSLSRGRSVRGAWPPPKEAEAFDEAPLKPITTEQLNINHPSPSPNYQSKFEYATDFSRSFTGTPTEDSPDPRIVRKSYCAVAADPIDYKDLLTSPSQSAKESSWRKRASEISITTNAARSTDEGDGSIEPIQLEKTPKEAGNTTPSIKDRISAYSGGGKKQSARKFPQRYAATGTYSKRDHPPKIDIYGNARPGVDERDLVERRREEDDRDDVPGLAAPEPSTVPPSPAARAAASAAAELIVRRNSNPSSPSNRSTSTSSTRNAANGNRAVGSYKAKPSAKQTSSAPVSEIESAEQIDNNSTTSSMSTDDFVRSSTQRDGTPPGSFPVNRIPSWSERTKGQGSYKQQQKPVGTNVTYSQEDVDRIVEARVRSQVADLEVRMEAKMERLEQRLEKRMNSKLNAMDGKMNEMTAMLKMLVAAFKAKQLESR